MSTLHLTLEAADKGIAEQWIGLWAALLGAAIGALAAGGVTYWLQRVARREALRTTCIHLTLKISRISSSLTALYHQTRDGIRDAEGSGVEGDIWNKMIPMSGGLDIHILPEELAVFVHMRDYEFINRVVMLDDRHNGVVTALGIYNVKRTALTDSWPAAMAGQAGTVVITDPEEYARVAPKIAEVKQIAEDLLAEMKRCTSEAQGVATDLGPRLRRYFKDKKFPILKITDDLKVEGDRI